MVGGRIVNGTRRATDDLVDGTAALAAFRLQARISWYRLVEAIATPKGPRQVEEAKRWATIAPNYAYGKDAVAAFQRVLTQLRPDVEFVDSQWPALFKIDAGAEVEALKRLEPDAIYNVTIGGDLAKFAREGKLRDLFEGRLIVGLLTGEPEIIDELPRVSRRLQTLRDWSDETFKQILPGAAGTGSAVGPGPPGRARIAMGRHRLGVVEDRLFGRDAAQMEGKCVHFLCTPGRAR